MKTEKERMLKALVHINDIQTLIQDNKFEKYLQDHLIVVEYELQRQLSLILSLIHISEPTRPY